MLCCHSDFVEDGETLVSNPAPTSTTDIATRIEPLAWFAELVEDSLDFLVRTLRPSGCRPFNNGLGIGHRSSQEIRRSFLLFGLFAWFSFWRHTIAV